MAAFGSLSLGPLTVPIWLLVIAGCLAGGLLAARVPLRAHRRVRARVTELVGNAVIAFVVVWKLSPVARNPRGILSDPLPLLMAAPGLLGLVAGSVAAIAAVAISLLRHRRLRRAALLPLALFVGVAGAGIGAAELASGLARPSRAAPELLLPLLGGGEVSLSALRGSVVVVNFWATWCPPCRAELPELLSFVRAPGTEGVTFLSVNLTSTEKSVDAVRELVEERGLPFAVPLDRTGEAASSWGVRVVPTTFVVSPRGEVTATRTGAVDAAWLRREVRRAAAYRRSIRAPSRSSGSTRQIARRGAAARAKAASPDADAPRTSSGS